MKDNSYPCGDCSVGTCGCGDVMNFGMHLYKYKQASIDLVIRETNSQLYTLNFLLHGKTYACVLSDKTCNFH